MIVKEFAPEEVAIADAYREATLANIGKRWREVPGAWEEDMKFFAEIGLLTPHGKAMVAMEIADRNR